MLRDNAVVYILYNLYCKRDQDVVFTMLLRVAIPILNGDFHVAEDGVNCYIGDSFSSCRHRPKRKRNVCW